MSPTKVLQWIAGKWTEWTLSTRFLIASSIVICSTMLFVGTWMDTRIRKSVIQNAAAASARFMDALISPAIQEMAQRATLTPRAKLVISDLIEDTSLGRSILEIKIWRLDGSIAFASDGRHVGDRPPITIELGGAIAGRIMADFNDSTDEESLDERLYGKPLFEVYAPVYEKGTDRIIAVSEFYEDATELIRDFTIARQQSWLVVGALTFGMLALLFGIVHRGSLLILTQKLALERQINELGTLLRQNEDLRARVTAANSNGAKVSEQALSRVGADLHDGPAQLLSFSLLRLHEISAGLPTELVAKNQDAIDAVTRATQDALREIRNISAGVSIPEVDRMTVSSVLRLAIEQHETRTGTLVNDKVDALPFSLPASVKICAFRLVQEGLNNAFRHAGACGQSVSAVMRGEFLVILVSDNGPGFEPENRAGCNETLGLRGLRHRIEALGGTFCITSQIGSGTTISAILPCSIET
jgi:signal transduction histidine kinase